MTDTFQDIIANRHGYARALKARTQKKVVGYLCTYMPEEIAYAAGAIPLRIIAGEEPSVQAERYMAQWTCPFSRGCLEEALTGKYAYLDAVVFPWTCSHTHTTFYYIGQYMEKAVTRLISLPKAMERTGAEPFLIAELAAFRDWLATFVGRPIRDEDLLRGIDLCNTNRSLMRRVYSLRREDPPPISGAQAMEMVLSSQVMDKGEHNALLTRWLEEIPKKPPAQKGKVRLMAVGSCVDKPQVLRLIEGMGADIVTDDLCTGSRYFWDDVMLAEDPLVSISRRLLGRVNCPAKLAGDRRYEQVLSLAEEYRADGVIVLHQKFCNPHGNDYPYLKSMLNTHDIPCLLLELDIPIPGGQIKNRVQTFVEMLETERVT